jgi:Leucine-rich repeat (LRR) protein
MAGLQRCDLSVCMWLHQLYINRCWITEFPPSIALLTDLIALDLSLNRLTSIDAIDFLQMSKLTLLNVSIRLLC